LYIFRLAYCVSFLKQGARRSRIFAIKRRPVDQITFKNQPDTEIRRPLARWKASCKK
jgi:hypothetical protein